jgi:hypothetical protein
VVLRAACVRAGAGGAGREATGSVSRCRWRPEKARRRAHDRAARNKPSSRQRASDAVRQTARLPGRWAGAPWARQASRAGKWPRAVDRILAGAAPPGPCRRWNNFEPWTKLCWGNWQAGGSGIIGSSWRIGQWATCGGCAVEEWCLVSMYSSGRSSSPARGAQDSRTDQLPDCAPACLPAGDCSRAGGDDDVG